MLLNEVQRQERARQQQQQELAELRAQNISLQKQLVVEQTVIATRLDRLEAAGSGATLAQR